MRKLVIISALFLTLLACKKESDNGSMKFDKGKNEMVSLMDNMMIEMHKNANSGDVDKDYAQMMSAHHKGAVEMSELLLKKGSDKELRSFARKVITAQQSEIEMMDKIPVRVISKDNEKFQSAMHKSMAAMMNKTIPVYNDIDKDYAAQMIPHHQSAVDMAKAYLKFGTNQQLIALSKNIILTQTVEIEQLKNWLLKHKLDK